MRRLKGEKREEVKNLLKLGCDKKLIQEKIFKDTGKRPTYKDLDNIQSEIRAKLKVTSDPKMIKKILEEEYGNLKLIYCILK